MNRRGFITTLTTGLAVATVDPEVLERLLWQPTKTIFLPPEGPRIIQLKAMVANINYGLFDLEVDRRHSIAYLEPADLSNCIKKVLAEHDKALWSVEPDLIVVDPKLAKVVDKLLKPKSFVERLLGI